MSMFEFDSAYAAHHLEVTLSPATNETVGLYADDEAEHRVQLTGLRPNDFAVFGHLLYNDKLIPISYLVTDYSSRHIATAVNSDHMEIFPEKYMTPRLRSAIQRIGERELSQFELPSTSRFIFQTDDRSAKLPD